MALTTARKLGPYEIVSRIGSGGMGEVYKAVDSRLDRIVAIKVLSQKFSENPEAKVRFEREAKTIAASEPSAYPHTIRCGPVRRERLSRLGITRR